MPTATGASGAALYGKKFPLALQTTDDAGPSCCRAPRPRSPPRARKLYTLCAQAPLQLWPKEALPGDVAAPAEQQKVIERVDDELAKDHAKPDELVAAHGAQPRQAARVHREARPPRPAAAATRLRVEPMPAFKRGSIAAEYLAPGRAPAQSQVARDLLRRSDRSRPGPPTRSSPTCAGRTTTRCSSSPRTRPTPATTRSTRTPSAT